MSASKLMVTRKQLAEFLSDPEAIKTFERLLSIVDGLKDGSPLGAGWDVALTQSISNLSIPGYINQYKYVRSDLRTSFAAPTGNADTLLSPLEITITPKKIGDIIHCQWTIMGELNSNEGGFRISVNGTVPSDGYNAESGNVQWSMLVPMNYDNDNATTPYLYTLTYIYIVTSLNTVIITPTVRASAGAAYIFYLNRPVANAGANASETGVSFGYIMEIAQ